MFKKLIFIISILFYSSISYGKTVEIDMLNKLGKEKMVYSVKVAKVMTTILLTMIIFLILTNIHYLNG